MICPDAVIDSGRRQSWEVQHSVTMDSMYNKLTTGAWQEMNISELGAKEDMIDGITEGTLILEGGYKVLTKDEIRRIFKDSLYKRRTNE